MRGAEPKRDAREIITSNNPALVELKLFHSFSVSSTRSSRPLALTSACGGGEITLAWAKHALLFFKLRSDSNRLEKGRDLQGTSFLLPSQD